MSNGKLNRLVYTVYGWPSFINASKSCTLQGKSTREIHGISGCITPSRVIILRYNFNMHCPILVIDRMNPGTPQKQLETPGMKCKSKDGREFFSTLHKCNHLMVVVERNWTLRGEDDKILISFWDLRDEPYIFKEHNIIYMIPSEILSEYELGEGRGGEIHKIHIQLSRAMMAINLVLNSKPLHHKQRFHFFLLLYRVNTTEPSQDTEGFHLLKTVKFVDNTRMWFSYPGSTTMNDKYLICQIGNGGTYSVEVHEIETLLSSMDTIFAPRKVLQLLNGKYVLEPGMSDRLAVFNTMENRLTILDLVSTNPITIVDTIEWRILGQPSEKYDLPDKKLKIKNIGGNWCCGSFLILQRLELPNTCKKHRQWTFKLNIVDPGTVEKRPEVKSQIKDIFDSTVSYPKSIMLEDCFIDVMGIVHVVTDTSGDADYLTVNCAQFQNINAAQAGYIRALEDSSSDNLCGLNAVDEGKGDEGKGDEGMGEDEEGKVAEEKAEKKKGDGFYPGNFFLFTFLLA